MDRPLPLRSATRGSVRLAARIGQDGADLSLVRIFGPQEEVTFVLLLAVLLAGVESPALVGCIFSDDESDCGEARTTVT